MLRRCLRMSTPRFGMVISPQDDGAFLNDFGTMLEIRNVRVLADGRSIVETSGTYRFRIIERKILDDYMVARVERCVTRLGQVGLCADGLPIRRFDDIPPELEREVERSAVASVVTHSTTMPVIPSIHRSQRPPDTVVAPPPRSEDRLASTGSAASTPIAATPNAESTPSTPHVATVVSKYPIEPATATLVRKCHDFLEKLRSNPMIVQRLNNIGPVPEDIGLFTFYVASVGPSVFSLSLSFWAGGGTYADPGRARIGRPDRRARKGKTPAHPLAPLATAACCTLDRAARAALVVPRCWVHRHVTLLVLPVFLLLLPPRLCSRSFCVYPSRLHSHTGASLHSHSHSHADD